MEPVSNHTPSFSPEWDPDPSSSGSDPDTSDPESALSTPLCPLDAEGPTTPSDRVRSLLESYAHPSAASGASLSSPATDNNAARTLGRESTSAYADAGRTSNGDGVFAGAALLKTNDPKSGVNVEVFSASIQAGAQNEIRAGLARLGYDGRVAGVGLSLSSEFFTARANAGIHNDDDSQGANLGAMATAAGIEATVHESGWSATVGFSLSAGFALSSGDRDSDGDARPERCFKGSIGPATLGVCTER